MVHKIDVKREFAPGLRHMTTENLSLSTQQKMGTFSDLGKAKQSKQEVWALPFIRCANDTVGL